LNEGIGGDSPRPYLYFAQFEISCTSIGCIATYVCIGNNAAKAQGVLQKGLQKKVLTQQMVDEELAKANLPLSNASNQINIAIQNQTPVNSSQLYRTNSGANFAPTTPQHASVVPQTPTKTPTENPLLVHSLSRENNKENEPSNLSSIVSSTPQGSQPKKRQFGSTFTVVFLLMFPRTWRHC
jgi:hypothetical protein